MKKICLSFFLIVGIISSALGGGLIRQGDDQRHPVEYRPGVLIVKFRPLALSKVHLRQTASISGIAYSGLLSIDRLNEKYKVSNMAPDERIRYEDAVMAHQVGLDRYTLLHVSMTTDLEAMAKGYAQDPNVEYASPDYRKYTQTVPNDPNYSKQWGHKNTGQMLSYQWSPVYDHTGSAVGTVGFDAGAETAWSGTQGYGSSSVIIGIIDSGTDWDHPDLAANIWTNPGETGTDGSGHDKRTNGIDDDGDGKIDDYHGWDFGTVDNNPADDALDAGHGTCTAGIAAAVANNGIGVAGIAGGCKIMPLKVADDSGYIYDSYITDAITYGADHGAKVLSMSLGGSTFDQPTQDACTYAWNLGAVVLAATGNDNASTVEYPAANANVIAVGAASNCGDRKRSSSSSADLNPGVTADPHSYTCDGERWWGSTYGINTKDASAAVDVIAPTILPTTDRVGANGYETGDYELYFNGTSCATPYAAGVCALIYSKNPAWTATQVRNQLCNTATDIINVESAAGWDRYTGYGMVNAGAAVVIDSIPPVISAISPGTPSGNTATITWTTDKSSTSVVNYGTTASYGSSTSGATGTSHSVALSGLTASTVYHYKVTSANTSGFSSSSADSTFTTGAPPSGGTSLTSIGVAYTQDFNTLATSGTSTTVPSGWLFSEVGGNTTYTAGAGTGTTGDTYSLGTGTNSDRAFGSLASNALQSTIGAGFTNNTGSTVTSLAVSFTMEQWRIGGPSSARADSSAFAYSTNATSLTTGTWTAFPALSLKSKITSGSAASLDGNAVANRSAVSATITGLTITSGSTFYIRWADANVSGNDDALGVDDFSLTPFTSGGCPTITLSPSSLPAGTNGTAYSQTVTASGGTAAYTYAVTTGALPTGLSLSSAGALSGTPTANGTYNFTVTATDANSCTGSKAYSISVTGGSCPTITLSPSSLPAGTNGTAYNQTITASGGTAAYTYAVTTGALPTGLSLASGGALTGTPTANGTYNFTVTATDANTCTGAQSYSISVTSSCPTITLSPSTLPNGTANAAYNQTITATGGTAAYTFAVTAGSLPAGLSLASGGALTGTPTATGTSNFTVTATDANTCTGTLAYSLTVNAAASTISLTSLGSAYTQDFNTLSATGTANSALPAGWLFLETGTNANTTYAADSGSSNSGNTYSYGWTSERALGTIASGTVLPTIGAGFTNNTGSTITSLAITFTGEEWRYGVTTPRTDSLRFSISTDATDLSTGTWTRNSTLDVISPNTSPTTAGKLDGNAVANRAAISATVSGLSIANGATFYIRWADVNIIGADDGLAVDDFSITPSGSGGCPTITLSPSTLPNGATGTAYNQTVTASGGTGSYTYAVTAGSLPTGLTLSSGGVLSGTPTVANTFNFTVTATDANTCTGNQAYGITITATPTNPSVVAGASPSSVTVGSATLITGTVTPGTNPASSGVTVTANLSSIGGSASQTLYDDASHGDVTGGDNVYSFSATVPGGNATGSKVVHISVLDAQSRSAHDSITVTVNPVSCPTITLSPSSLPDGTAGTAYSQTVSAGGGVAAYTFAVTAGSLPAGLTLASGGALTGTPTVTGGFSITVTATDNNGCTGSKQYSCTIGCPTITISPSTLPGDTVGNMYSQALTAGGGSAPYRFAISSGSVPTGLSLGLRGALTGTLSAAGSYNFTVGVIDTNGCLATQSYSVNVVDAPADTMITITVPVDAKWNIVANAVTGVSDSVASLFPGATSPAYWFNFSGYAQSAEMLNGLGYWLKFPNAHTVNLHGFPVAEETLHVFTGWNLIGSTSYDIPATAITSNSAVFSSQVFGYSNGYTVATVVKPGKGYWVKAATNATVILTAPGAPAKTSHRTPSAVETSLQSPHNKGQAKKDKQ